MGKWNAARPNAAHLNTARQAINVVRAAFPVICRVTSNDAL